MSDGGSSIGVRTYFLVFTALLFLTASTVWVAFRDLGAYNNVVALGIAVVKATLVVLFFMHLKVSSTVNKLAVASTLFFFLLLIGLVFADFLTRNALHAPRNVYW
jgi:cytochrome c oxidase subunit 4